MPSADAPFSPAGTLPSTARIEVHPIHAMLVPFPIVCFIGAFITDIAYVMTLDVMWERFSIWLIFAGLVMSVFAIIAGLIDLMFTRGSWGLRPTWFHMLGAIVVLALSVLNAFVHSRDGYTAVFPQGIILSGAVVLILLFTGWMGWAMVYRHRAGDYN